MKKLNVQHDARLLEYLVEALPDESRTTLKSYLAHRQILINGRMTTAFDHPLRRGDLLEILDRGVQRQNPNSPLRIIYEDPYIMVVEKKHGLLTISTGKENEVTAYSLLTEHVRSTNPRNTPPEDNHIFIVHRLDRETSGLLLFAKTREVQQALQDGWNDRITERRYVAVVEGETPEREGKIVSWLTENPKSLKMMSSPTDDGGKKAITNYRVIKTNGKYTLVHVDLETGRKNQIRVQFASIGCPVAGDKRYGAATNPIGRLCLHAQTIAFRHPVTGEAMRFDTGIPESFT